MGERGHSLHVLGQDGRELLSTLGQGLVILASNDRWTSFVPIKGKSFDDAESSRTIDRAVLHVWFDDDVGVSVRTYASGSFLGEFSLPGDEAEIGASALDLFKEWEALGILTKIRGAELRTRIADSDTVREWAFEHGLERLLELPCFEPLPPDVPEKVLLSLLPASATVLDARRPRRMKARPTPTPSVPAPMSASKDSWTDQEKRTLALHCTYWAEVFSMNNWKLYNRYKKHLPADQRPDVDRLCGFVAQGDTAALRSLVESILSRIWGCEDWDKLIRDPNLMDGEEDAWKNWLARL